MLYKNALIALFLVNAHNSFAGLDFEIRGKSSGNNKSTSGGIVTTVNEPVVMPNEQREVRDCQVDNEVPLEFLQATMDNFENFRVRAKNIDRDKREATFEITVPSYLATCFKLEIPAIEQVDNRFYVRVANGYDFQKNPPIIPRKDNYENYKQCLRDNKVLLADGKNGEYLDFDSVPKSKGQIITVTKKIDPSKNVEVYFKSPKTSGYGGTIDPVYGSFVKQDLPCHHVENLAPQTVTVYESLETKYAEKAYNLCNNPSIENFQEIDQMYTQLIEMKDTLGNGQTLISTIKPIREQLLKEKVESIFDKLAKIESSFAGKDKIDSKLKAQKEVKKYIDLLNEYENLIIKPGQEEIANLLKEREKASEKRKEQIDERIAEINEQIGALGKRDAGLKTIYTALGEFNLGSQADKVIVPYAKSTFLSRVYSGDDDKKGRSRSMTFEEVDAEIKKTVGVLKSQVLPKWEEVASVKSGDPSAIQASAERLQNLQEKKQMAYQNFMKEEQEGYKNCQQYLGVMPWMNNSYRCQQWMNGRSAKYSQFNRQLESFKQKENMEMVRYNNYSQLWQASQAAAANSAGVQSMEYFQGENPYNSLFNSSMGMPMMGAGLTGMNGMPGQQGQQMNGQMMMPQQMMSMSPYPAMNGQQGMMGMGMNNQMMMNGMGGGYSPVPGGTGQQPYSFMNGMNPYSGNQIYPAMGTGNMMMPQQPQMNPIYMYQ